MASADLPKGPKCQIALRGLGQLPIRTAGATPGWHFFLGELADLDETIKPLDLHRCEKYGFLKFFDHDFSLPE